MSPGGKVSGTEAQTVHLSACGMADPTASALTLTLGLTYLRPIAQLGKRRGACLTKGSSDAALQKDTPFSCLPASTEHT